MDITRVVVVPLALLSAVSCSGVEGPRYSEEVALDRALEEAIALGYDTQGPGFSDVRGTGTDSQGRIWVAEWDALIHVFDPEGRHLQTWNRKGEGPAEFRYIAGFDLDPSTDRVVVRDVQQVFLFDTSFQEISRWMVPRTPGMVGSFPGVRFGPSGSGVLVPVALSRDSVVQDTIRLVWNTGKLLRFDDQGSVTDTVGTLVGGWMRLMPGVSAHSRAAFSGEAVWAPLGSLGMLIGDGQSDYRFAVVSGRDTLRVLGRELPTEPLPEVEGPPFNLGFVYRVVFDPARQEILACRTERPGEGGGPRQPARVDHFKVSGEYLGTLTWPSCPRSADRAGTIYTVVYDQLGVPLVKGFRYAGEGRAPGTQRRS